MQPAMTHESLQSRLLQHTPPSPLSYGTAGFRGPAQVLPAAIFRCGALAALRSVSLDGRTVGVMVTASHNPAQDNGLKLVEPDGSMLDAEWERIATPFVNATSEPLRCLQGLVQIAEGGKVLLGWDTRESAKELVRLVKEGVQAAGGIVEELGEVTTPQLHFLLRARDRGEDCALADYYALLKKAYARLVGKKRPKIELLAVDCANGVGAVAMKEIAVVLKELRVVNCPGDGGLNERCGADYVQKKRVMPELYSNGVDCDIWASLDGDADRLVMYRKKGDKIDLADGDRFATLACSFVADLLKKSGVPLSVGVAQTAYSNGGATQFLEALEGIDVVVAKTGVKHLEKAVKGFDVGVYWEPNGHGTVIFGEGGLKRIKEEMSKLEGDAVGSEQRQSLEMLVAISELANQAVGDGVADLLLVLAILTVKDVDFDEWLRIYEERCSWNLAVRVADKAVIQTTDCDRVIKEPVQLRDAVAKATGGEESRAFVRPSGTEDIVRVYAEAPVGCEERAREMALEVGRAVYDFCGGVGERL